MILAAAGTHHIGPETEEAKVREENKNNNSMIPTPLLQFSMYFTQAATATSVFVIKYYVVILRYT